MSQLTALRTLVDPATLARVVDEHAHWLADLPLDPLLDLMFVRNLRVRPAPEGDTVSYAFELVVPDGFGVDLPVGNMRIAVNSPSAAGGPSAFPLSVSVQVPVRRYLDDVDSALLDATPAARYALLTRIVGATPGDLLEAALATLVDAPHPVQAFLADYAAAHGPLGVAVDPDPAVTRRAIVEAAAAAGVDLTAHIFSAYVDGPDEAAALERLSFLFAPWRHFAPDELARLDMPVIRAALHELSLALSFPRALLVPIKSAAHQAANPAPGVAVGAPLPAPHQAWAKATLGGLAFSSDTGLDVAGTVEFAIDDCELGTTGIRLHVDGVTLDLSPKATPAVLRAFGFDAGFVGLHARGAELRWLPQIRIPGLPEAGLVIAVRDLAIGNQGLGIGIDQAWAIDGNDPFGTGSQLAGHLPNGWGVALRSAVGRFAYRRTVDAARTARDEWEAALTVAGLLELPFWQTALAAAFSFERLPAGHRVRLALGVEQPLLAIPLGNGNVLTIDRLAIEGVLAADGTFSLGGTARGAIEVGAGALSLLQATFDVPDMTFVHDGDSALTFHGIFNAVLFAGTPFAATLDNFDTHLHLVADDAGVTAFSLDLAGFDLTLAVTDRITMELSDCLLDLNPDGSPQPVLDAGFSPDFMGLLAQSGRLVWRLPGVAGPTALEVGRVVVGNDGIGLRQSWEQDELSVELYPDWVLSLTDVDGLLVFAADGPPSRLRLAGRLTFPILDATVDALLYLQRGPAGDQVRLSITAAPLDFAFGGAGSVTADALTFDGTLTDSSLMLLGEIKGGTLALTDFPESFALGSATVTFERRAGYDQLAVDVDGLEIPLTDSNTVSFASRLVIERDGTALTSIAIAGSAVWQDLVVGALPPFLPQPPADTTIDALLQWEDGSWKLRFGVSFGDVGALLALLPTSLRPETRNVQLAFEATHQDGTGRFAGELAVALDVRWRDLPPLPGGELLRIDTGDAAGWISLTLRGGMRDDGAGNLEPYLTGALGGALAIDINFPGLPQRRPPIHVQIDSLALELAGGGAALGGATLAGSFVLRPIDPADMDLPVPPAMVQPMQHLLDSLGLDGVGGTVELALQIHDDGFAMSMTASFTDAAVEIDVFDMLASVTRGIAAPAGLDDPTRNIDLDIEVGFSLRRIALQLGAPGGGEPPGFAFELAIGLSFAGASSELVFALSDEAFSLGVPELRVPIALPKLPMRRADLDALHGAFGRWDYAGRWLAQAEPALAAAIDAAEQEMEVLRQQVSALEAALAGPLSAAERAARQAELFALRARALPAKQKEVFHLTAKKFLIESVFAIHNVLSTDTNRATYQGLVEQYQTLLDHTIGAISIDTDLSLVIVDARFVLPFHDPSDVRVEGGARLDGFALDDPLKPLGDIELRLGVSAEAIYFAVEGGPDPIPLPGIGRYRGGNVWLDHLRIGYGYTRNSLNVSFAGALHLPETLVEDADTSEAIGAGLRLPVDSRLRFKLDLIPIVLGEVDFLLPLFEFDVDLRRAAPAPVFDTANCTPAWDGLQLVVPGVIRADVKRVRFSPFFGPLPALNYTLSYDLDVGNDMLGVTYVCDNYLLIAPLFGTSPLPLLADGNSPFFDNICVNARIAGFEVNFDLQRPLPSMSPLALFELLGFIADPMMEIDPEGALANTVRATIRNARIILPPAVVRAFPEWGRAVEPEVTYTLNLATVIALAQAAMEGVGGAIEATADFAGDVGAFVDHLRDRPPDISAGALLRALPPELRRVELHGAFAGFDATAMFFLLTAEDAAELFGAVASPAVPRRPGGLVALPSALADRVPRIRGGRLPPFRPVGDATDLAAGVPLPHGFRAADLAAIPPLAPDVAAVLVAARVSVFDLQAYRFVGYFATDGNFSLVSGLELAPLSLKVAGIAFALPLELHGRLALRGRAAGADSWAEVKVGVSGAWDVLPRDVARLEIGSAKTPARLAIASTGRFALQGSGRLLLFADAAVVEGSVDVSESHCFVAGRFVFAPAVQPVGSRLINLVLNCDGQLGPGPHFEIGGGGSLEILGQPFVSVRGHISEREARVAASLRLKRGTEWPIGPLRLGGVRLELDGRIDLAGDPSRPTFSLAGDCAFDVLGATISGRGSVAADHGVWSIEAGGALEWQGRDWLEGAVRVRAAEVRIAGRTSFALDLTPQELPAGVQLANLYFRIDLGGEFRLTPASGLQACELEVDWSLAVTMPGSEQQFPIAMQKKRFAFSAKANVPDEIDLLPLIDVDAALFLPLDTVTLPIPLVNADQFTQYYWYWDSVAQPGHVTYKRVSIANSGSTSDPKFPSGVGKTGDLDIAAKIAEAFSLLPPPVKINVPVYGATGWKYVKFTDTNAPLPSVKVPRVSSSVPASVPANQRFALFKLPTHFSAGFAKEGVDLRTPLSFSLRLTWKDHKLGLTVVRDGKRKFTPFEKMFG